MQMGVRVCVSVRVRMVLRRDPGHLQTNLLGKKKHQPRESLDETTTYHRISRQGQPFDLKLGGVRRMMGMPWRSTRGSTRTRRRRDPQPFQSFPLQLGGELRAAARSRVEGEMVQREPPRPWKESRYAGKPRAQLKFLHR